MGAGMSSLRKYSLAAGLFYLLTFVSIPTLALYRSVRGPSFVTGPSPDLPVIVGVLLEMIVALAGIGTAVALYPVVSRQGQARAVGFVASRVLEAATTQSFIPAVNGVLLGSLLFQSRLVPRWLPVLGFIGAFLLVASWFAVLGGAIAGISPVAALAALPIAVWEFSLGVYLTFWGFKASPILADLSVPPSHALEVRDETLL